MLKINNIAFNTKEETIFHNDYCFTTITSIIGVDNNNNVIVQFEEHRYTNDLTDDADNIIYELHEDKNNFIVPASFDFEHETDDFKDWFLQERFDKLVNFVTEFGESPF